MAKRPSDPDAEGDARPQPSSAPRHLPPPSAEALRRAAPLFAQLVGLGPSSEKATPASGAAREPAVEVPARHYPLAAKLLAAYPQEVALPEAAAARAPQDVTVQTDLEAEMPFGAAPLPLQLPGFVRKSVAANLSEVVPQVLLEDVAQMALVDTGADGAPASFVILFREELLGELQCRLEVGPTGQITATFVAADAHTRRLLTHEVPRLRAKLTSHGLRDVLMNISDS